MKRSIKLLTVLCLPLLIFCNQKESKKKQIIENRSSQAANLIGTKSQSYTGFLRNIVNVTASSPNHSTLFAALNQADLISSLSNVGPFTVFAPTNAAFDNLPKGTLDVLMKDESKEELQNMLKYHLIIALIKPQSFKDGQSFEMINGDNITISVRNGVVKLNNSATILTSLPASNGIIYVIDGVLLETRSK